MSQATVGARDGALVLTRLLSGIPACRPNARSSALYDSSHIEMERTLDHFLIDDHPDHWYFSDPLAGDNRREGELRGGGLKWLKHH